MFLLDTNVVSELRRRDKADARVRAWVDAASATDFYLSVITLLEIEAGALLVARRDKAQGDVFRAWIDQKILPNFAGRILPVDTAVAMQCARLHVPDPRPELDALIAATALVHRLVVVTRNTADFAPMGVDLVNPWE